MRTHESRPDSTHSSHFFGSFPIPEIERKIDIPYISRVDAGTFELVRSFGVEPVTSAELMQKFGQVFSPDQHQMHVEASDKTHRIIQEAFAEIARRIRADESTTGWDVAQFMLRRYKQEGMQSRVA